MGSGFGQTTFAELSGVGKLTFAGPSLVHHPPLQQAFNNTRPPGTETGWRPDVAFFAFSFAISRPFLGGELTGTTEPRLEQGTVAPTSDFPFGHPHRVPLTIPVRSNTPNGI